MMSLAGEGDGVRIYVAETIGIKREFFGNGLVSGSSQIGVLIATFACFLSSSDIMPQYFWRMNFIFGGMLGLVLYYFRQYIGESTEFKKTHSKDHRLTKQDIPLLIYSTIINGFIGGIYHFQIIFLGSFLSTVTMIVKKDLMSTITMIIVILYIISAMLSGYLADKYNPKKQIIISLLLTISCAIFNTISMANEQINIPLLICTTSLIAFYSVPLQIILKRKMPINKRLKLFSFSHSMGSLIFSSSSAFTRTVWLMWLRDKSSNETVTPSLCR
jgi:predicted MFS family arabinose efflux permease